MQLPFHEKLIEKAKSSWPFAVLVFVLVFIWEAATHEFFTWFDQRVLNTLGPTAASLMRWTVSNPWTFLLILSVCYCLAVIGWAAISAKSRPPLEIVSLRDGDSVEYRQMVFGVRRGRRASVQLLVFSGERWHPQWRAELYDNKWRAKCQFGDVNSRLGSTFRIVAISSATQISEPIVELPRKAKRSEILNVNRSASPPVQTDCGIYLGRIRTPITEGWVSYTTHVGTIEGNDMITFKGVWDNGWRYPRQDGQRLSPLVILGLRFKPNGEVNFYAHFRGPVVLYISSRFSDWGVPNGEQEFRVPLPASALANKWHTIFIYLPCVEQILKRSLDVIERFSVRGNLSVSHIWCVERLQELPISFLVDATMLCPPNK